MSKRKFLVAFAISRTARHFIAVGLGLYYGRSILRLWNRISAEYATTILIITWTVILISCVISFRQLYKASKAAGTSPNLTPESSSTV
jgi:hypothetical protein